MDQSPINFFVVRASFDRLVLIGNHHCCLCKMLSQLFSAKRRFLFRFLIQYNAFVFQFFVHAYYVGRKVKLLKQGSAAAQGRSPCLLRRARAGKNKTPSPPAFSQQGGCNDKRFLCDTKFAIYILRPRAITPNPEIIRRRLIVIASVEALPVTASPPPFATPLPFQGSVANTCLAE